MSHDDAARRHTIRGAVHILHDLCEQRVEDEGVDVIGYAEELGRLAGAVESLGAGPWASLVDDRASGEAALVIARDALWLACADLDNDNEIAKLAHKVSKLVARRLVLG